jgi:Tol biopolymer transport system component
VVRAGLVCEVTWSPDAKRLAFVMTPLGLDPRLTWTLEVYVADADGHPRLRRVTFDRREDREPAWRPDGRITFIRAERRYAVDPDRVGEPTLFHEPGVRPTARIYPSDSFACP